MNRRILVIIIIGITILVWLLILNQTKTIKVEKDTEEKITHQKPEIMEKKEIETKRIKIVTLYDNYQVDPKLETGWGFSCLIRRSPKGEGEPNILFDTGADSPTLLSNMEKLEIKPEEIDIMVLSHIHGDHVDGLEGFLEKNGKVKVYIPASFPNSIREKIKSFGGAYIDTSTSAEISNNVHSTEELGTWIKEQSLIVKTEKGIVVITGCAHPGIVNIIKKAKEIFPKEGVYLVLGGFHLSGTSDIELKNIINDFRKLDVQKVAPCYCAGDRCRELFKEE